MEGIETTALSTFTNAPTFWLRYVDDTYANPEKDIKELFLAHLNSIDENVN